MSRLNVKILLCHLCQQVADVVDDDIQSVYHFCGGPGQFSSLIPADGLRNRGVQIPFHQKLHSSGTCVHGCADIGGQFQCNHNGRKNGCSDHNDIDDKAKISVSQVF